MKKENCNENAVTSLIINHVPSAQLLSSVGAEMEFVLSSEHSSGFEALFQEIESKYEKNYVIKFHIMIITHYGFINMRYEY